MPTDYGLAVIELTSLHPQPAFSASAPVLILSPHFDDAVFNHWSLLMDASLDVQVVNVFAGVPETGVCAVGDLHRGVRDSAEYVEMRRAEDAHALSLVGRSPINLDIVEYRYRVQQLQIPLWLARLLGRPKRSIVNAPWRKDREGIHEEIIDRLAPISPSWSMVCAPVGIGGHPDHHVVREVARRIAREWGIPVRLYADIPYACADGWPGWTSEPAPTTPDPRIEQEWSRTASATTFDALPSWRDARVVRLDQEAIDRKRRAVATYVTQFEDLDRFFNGRMRALETWSMEAFWCVPSS